MYLTSALKREYEDLYAACEISDRDAVNGCLNRIQRNQSRYQEVSAETGVPWYVIAAIHCLESGFNFGAHLHNGDPLTSRTVGFPPGRPVSGDPPFTWEDSAMDALEHDGALTVRHWDFGTCLWFLEGYNGWGYKTGRGQATTPPRRSPYLWSKTNHYERGKFVRDGVFDPNAVSNQVGSAALLKGLETRGLISFSGPPVMSRPLLRYGDSGEAVEELQRLLNRKSGAGLDVDGVFGPRTESAVRRFQESKRLSVDCIVGPNTWGALLEESTSGSRNFSRGRLAQIAEEEGRLNLTWLGNGAARKYTRKFQSVFGTGRFPWCAAFVTWCCEEAGLRMPTRVPGDTNGFTFALCEAWQQWAIREGFYYDAPGFTAEAGDISVFDQQGATYPDFDDENHIGIFLRMDGDAYIFAEGNVHDQTAVKKRYLPYIQGFIRLPDGYNF